MLAMAVAMIIFIGRRGDRTSSPSNEVILHGPLPLVTLQSTELPSTPFLVDWCEGDQCEERVSKTVVCDSNLYQQADLTSEVVGKVSAGEVLSDRTLFTKVLKVGSYAHDKNKRGVLVAYSGEQMWATFMDGKWNAISFPTEAEQKKAQLELPKTEPWALVKTAQGVTGFVAFFEGTQHAQCPIGLIGL